MQQSLTKYYQIELRNIQKIIHNQVEFLLGIPDWFNI